MILLLSREGFEADSLDDFKGLNQRCPWWAFIMLLVDVLAGRHPADGRLLCEVRGASRRWSTRGFIWLAVVAVLFSLIGAFYYLRIVKLMYFDDPVDRVADRGAAATRARCCRSNGLALLVLGILPQQLMGSVRRRALTQSQFALTYRRRRVRLAGMARPRVRHRRARWPSSASCASDSSSPVSSI